MSSLPNPERCKERNRDHARKTRLRKKMVLDNMKERIGQLQMEMTELKVVAEEMETASILLQLSTKSSSSDDASQSKDGLHFSAGYGHRIPVYNVPAAKVVSLLRVAVRSEAAARKNAEFSSIEGVIPQTARFNHQAETHSGARCEADDSDEDDDDDEEDADSFLSAAQGTDSHMLNEMRRINTTANPKDIEQIRKERNKIHARLTRGRKKLFTAKMAELISFMEAQNERMRQQVRGNAARQTKLSDGTLSHVTNSVPPLKLVGTKRPRSPSSDSVSSANQTTSRTSIGSPQHGCSPVETTLPPKVISLTVVDRENKKAKINDHSKITSRDTEIGTPSFVVTAEQLQQIELFLQHSTLPPIAEPYRSSEVTSNVPFGVSHLRGQPGVAGPSRMFPMASAPFARPQVTPSSYQKSTDQCSQPPSFHGFVAPSLPSYYGLGGYNSSRMGPFCSIDSADVSTCFRFPG